MGWFCRSYHAVTASQIQHHLVSTLLGFYTLKLKKRNSKLGAVGISLKLSAPWAYNRKLDGVGPVDNRPSTDKLHHFVKKNKKKNKNTCDT